MAVEVLDHTGDIGIRVTAPTREALFLEAARATTDIMVDASGARRQRGRDFVVEAEDPASLLRAWLSELIVAFSAEGLICVDVDIRSLDDRRLVAQATGDEYDPERHPLRTELKAVTWHQLDVRRTADGWEAQVIFDV